MTVSIFATALKDVREFFEALPDIADQAAVMAINQVAERDGLVMIRSQMRKEVNFPSGYLEGQRLRVTRRARSNDLEAIIRGRDRATSLARFAAGQNPINTRNRGVRVDVGKNTRTLRKAFLVNLRNGNMGLAVRLKPGQTLDNSQGAVKLSNNVYLLYGPSVDQVFRGVADSRADAIADMVTNQFLRQFARISRG